jgi:hypothetical protein
MSMDVSKMHKTLYESRQVSSITRMDKSMRASPRCCKWNANDVMKDEPFEGVSCKLSLTLVKPHNVIYVHEMIS